MIFNFKQRLEDALEATSAPAHDPVTKHPPFNVHYILMEMEKNIPDNPPDSNVSYTLVEKMVNHTIPHPMKHLVVLIHQIGAMQLTESCALLEGQRDEAERTLGTLIKIACPTFFNRGYTGIIYLSGWKIAGICP